MARPQFLEQQLNPHSQNDWLSWSDLVHILQKTQSLKELHAILKAKGDICHRIQSAGGSAARKALLRQKIEHLPNITSLLSKADAIGTTSGNSLIDSIEQELDSRSEQELQEILDSPSGFVEHLTERCRRRRELMEKVQPVLAPLLGNKGLDWVDMMPTLEAITENDRLVEIIADPKLFLGSLITWDQDTPVSRKAFIFTERLKQPELERRLLREGREWVDILPELYAIQSMKDLKEAMANYRDGIKDCLTAEQHAEELAQHVKEEREQMIADARPTLKPLLHERGLEWSDVLPLLEEIKTTNELRDVLYTRAGYKIHELLDRSSATNALIAKLRRLLTPLLEEKKLEWRHALPVLEDEAIESKKFLQQAVQGKDLPQQSKMLSMLVDTVEGAVNACTSKTKAGFVTKIKLKVRKELKDRGLKWCHVAPLVDELQTIKQLQRVLEDPISLVNKGEASRGWVVDCEMLLEREFLLQLLPEEWEGVQRDKLLFLRSTVDNLFFEFVQDTRLKTNGVCFHELRDFILEEEDNLVSIKSGPYKGWKAALTPGCEPNARRHFEAHTEYEVRLRRKIKTTNWFHVMEHGGQRESAVVTSSGKSGRIVCVLGVEIICGEESEELFSEGETVRANYFGQGNWKRAKVTFRYPKADGKRLYNVLYDEDKETEMLVSALNIRLEPVHEVGKRVHVEYNGECALNKDGVDDETSQEHVPGEGKFMTPVSITSGVHKNHRAWLSKEHGEWLSKDHEDDNKEYEVKLVSNRLGRRKGHVAGPTDIIIKIKGRAIAEQQLIAAETTSGYANRNWYPAVIKRVVFSQQTRQYSYDVAYTPTADDVKAVRQELQHPQGHSNSSLKLAVGIMMVPEKVRDAEDFEKGDVVECNYHRPIKKQLKTWHAAHASTRDQTVISAHNMRSELSGLMNENVLGKSILVEDVLYLIACFACTMFVIVVAKQIGLEQLRFDVYHKLLPHERLTFLREDAYLGSAIMDSSHTDWKAKSATNSAAEEYYTTLPLLPLKDTSVKSSKNRYVDGSIQVHFTKQKEYVVCVKAARLKSAICSEGTLFFCKFIQKYDCSEVQGYTETKPASGWCKSISKLCVSAF
jgi:hypothetical protein